MACYHPLDGYREAGGGVRIGYEPPGSTEKLRLPCGECFGCRMEYARTWALRCVHESRLYDSSLFVTLTYDDDNLLWHRSLEVDHIQRFMKRLRKRFDGDQVLAGFGGRPIRYFGAGEYGSLTDRPHWHLLLFNLRLPDYEGEPHERECASLSRLWPYGAHEVDRFSPGRAAYVAGYAAKKVRGRLARKERYEVMHPETGEVYERRPEFSVMSRRPGIGVPWFERHLSDFRPGYVTSAGGVKDRLPRLYREYLSRDADWAYTDEIRREDFLLDLDAAELTAERLSARETVAKARKSFFTQERGL